MSGQQSNSSTPCRIPKTPTNAGKVGPLKATIPISGVVKPSSNVKNAISPTPGPPVQSFSWRNRASPDHASGQRSPGSLSCKGKSKYHIRPVEVMRRTASLDAIYLKGHWPRDHFYWGNLLECLQVDKSTQTEDSDLLELRKVHYVRNEEDSMESKDFILKHLPYGDGTLNSSSQTFTSCIISPTVKIHPVKPLPRSSIRNSVEGLNQEIEIVLRTGADDHHSERYELRQVTPEGHRAPLAEMLRSNRSRSVNTQTPQDFNSSGESYGSSPDNEEAKLGTSPQINKFLAREPPDGCEKVRLKSLDEMSNILVDHIPQPNTFKLKPSLGSAFKILQPALNPNKQEPTLAPNEEMFNQ
ncbi:hypothetical protein ABEB36_012416 [Hypothenemus hampei]|uniref:Uncharacterized protein n=1 Tax=Hypothenemus hampei TaxID=57062 RepID=A0ABD1EBA6_HYPHA